MTRSLILILACAMGAAQAQTAKPLPNTPHSVKTPFDTSGMIMKACDREGDKGCGEVLSVTKDVHGCNPWSGFIWDEKTKTCYTDGRVYNTTGEIVTCHAEPRTPDGYQRVVCSYKPAPPKP